MYKLLIVDDEYYERKGLQRQIDWRKYGIVKVDLAANGTVACQKFEAELYDIVITDVKMPIMDGVTMAKKMKEFKPETKFIFVSGYDDFHYVRQAVQLQAYDYLLKPVGNELEAKIQNIITEFNEIRGVKENEIRQNKKMALQEELLGREVLKHYINANWKSFWDILDRLSFQKFSFWVIIYGHADSFLYDGEMTYQYVRNACLQSSDVALVGMSEQQLLCVLACDVESSGETLAEMLSQWRMASQQNMQWRFVSHIFPDTSDRTARVVEWREILESDWMKAPEYSLITQSLMSIIKTRYMEEVSLIKIAEELLYTPNYLSSVFKCEVGVGFYRYLTGVRMKKAAYILQTTSKKVYQVANAVGYHDTVAFIKQFRHTFGCTPSQYRNRSEGGIVPDETV